MEVRQASSDDKQAVIKILSDCWGSKMIGSRGVLKDASLLPALIAQDSESEILGLLTYEIHDEDKTLEVVTLNALSKFSGIGTHLLEEVAKVAKSLKCIRVCLATSNDSIDALRFYQRRGYRMTRVLTDSITKLREVKPSIPMMGDYNIPLHDEVELELIL